MSSSLTDVGIGPFFYHFSSSSCAEEWTGTIKQEPEDFVVREISIEGDVAGEKPIVVPPDDTTCSVAADPVEEPVRKKTKREEEKEDPMAVLQSLLLDQEMLHQLDTLHSSSCSERIEEDPSAHTTTTIISFPSPPEKADRTRLHSALRRLYPWLVGETRGETTVIRVDTQFDHLRILNRSELYAFAKDFSASPITLELPTNTTKEDRRTLHHAFLKRYRTKTIDPTHVRLQHIPPKPNCYYRTTICKRNLEHGQMLAWLPSSVGVAGIKDKRAVTYQFGTFRQPHAFRRDQLQCLGDWVSVPRPLRKGDLWGNRFEIWVRNVQGGPLRTLEARLSTLTSTINFFGEQRVGAAGSGIRSLDIGRAMLQGNYEKAVDLVLSGNVNDESDMAHARRLWKETHDIEGVWKALPKNGMPRERAILKGLKRYPGDWLAALRTLSYNERTFWITAYQSYVWNVMASERWKRHGASVVAGDLLQRKGSEEVEVYGEASAKATIHDVILPLPGSDVQYPSNDIGDYYREFLQTERVVFDRSKDAESTAKGAYRRLVVSPTNFSYKLQEPDVFLKFDLPKGSFATMWIRELLHTTQSLL